MLLKLLLLKHIIFVFSMFVKTKLRKKFPVYLEGNSCFSICQERNCLTWDWAHGLPFQAHGLLFQPLRPRVLSQVRQFLSYQSTVSIQHHKLRGHLKILQFFSKHNVFMTGRRFGIWQDWQHACMSWSRMCMHAGGLASGKMPNIWQDAEQGGLASDKTDS